MFQNMGVKAFGTMYSWIIKSALHGHAKGVMNGNIFHSYSFANVQ